MLKTNILTLIPMACMLFITTLLFMKQRKLIIHCKRSNIFRIVMLIIGAIVGSVMIYKRQESLDGFLGLSLFIEFYLISRLKQGIYENGFWAYANSCMEWSQLIKVEVYNKTYEVQILYYNNVGSNELAFEKKSFDAILHILREHLDDEIIKVINKI